MDDILGRLEEKRAAARAGGGITRIEAQHRRDLMGLLTMNRRLFKAYLFKEQFEHAWTYTTEKGMREFLGRISRT